MSSETIYLSEQDYDIAVRGLAATWAAPYCADGASWRNLVLRWAHRRARSISWVA